MLFLFAPRCSAQYSERRLKMHRSNIFWLRTGSTLAARLKVGIWVSYAIAVFPAIASGQLTGRLAYDAGNRTIHTGCINNGILGSDSTVPLPITPGGPPQWSPDGEYLTFSGPPGSGSRINVVRPDGSDFRTVTNGSVGDQVEPDFSPDGSQIVFHGVYGHINTVSSAGTNNSPTDTGVPGGHTRWSPTGNKIVFTNWGFTYDSDMFVLDLDTSTTFQITFHAPGVDAFNRADWSPDGTKLAVNRLDKATNLYDVYLIDVTDLANPGTPVNLTGDMPGSDESGGPTWSLDGQYIVFGSNSDGSYDIWAMKADGSQKINLTNTPDVNENSPAIGDACAPVPVPTVSEWGLAVLTLLGCTAGTILFGGRARKGVL
jgi:Tol biopolymer transport system component